MQPLYHRERVKRVGEDRSRESDEVAFRDQHALCDLPTSLDWYIEYSRSSRAFETSGSCGVERRIWTNESLVIQPHASLPRLRCDRPRPALDSSWDILETHGDTLKRTLRSSRCSHPQSRQSTKWHFLVQHGLVGARVSRRGARETDGEY